MNSNSASSLGVNMPATLGSSANRLLSNLNFQDGLPSQQIGWQPRAGSRNTYSRKVSTEMLESAGAEGDDMRLARRERSYRPGSSNFARPESSVGTLNKNR